MVTDTKKINNFILQKESAAIGRDSIEICDTAESGLCFVFYDSGLVDLDVQYGSKKSNMQLGSGIATSFFFSEEVTFVHRISGRKPLRSILISPSEDYLTQLSEGRFGVNSLENILNPVDDFAMGTSFYMNHDMHLAVDKIFNSTYAGAVGDLYLESQMLELLAHYLELSVPNKRQKELKKEDRDRLYFAKEILLKKMEEPPSLKELSRLIGLNEYKLKKGFKHLFGLPVYKYLQVKRLESAHNLLIDSEISVQQAAYSVGYESLSSFSNAFLEKYGYRPSKIRR